MGLKPRSQSGILRIAHVTDSSIYNFDGISTYVNELLECGGRLGHEPLVLTAPPLDPGKLRTVSHGAAVKEFPKLAAFSSDKFVFALPWGMKKILADFDPDVVWIHTIGPLGVRAARLAGRGRRVLYTKHCFDGDLWCTHLQIPPALHWFFQWAALVIEGWVLGPAQQALYHFEDEGLIRNRGAHPKFTYFPPPIDGRFLTEKSHRTGWCRDKTLILGFCGRLDPEKGLEEIFAAAELYQGSAAGPKIRLLLIGDGARGRELCARHPKVDAVITGFVDDVIPHLDRLDAFVLASKTETTSLSTLEAYARGLPIFSRRVGFLGLRPGKFRRVFTFDDAAGLAVLIRDKLETRMLPPPAVPAEADPAIITFAQLHGMVAGSLHEKTGALPARPETVVRLAD